MQRLKPYDDVLVFDNDPLYDADDYLMDQAALEYEWLEEIAADLEDLNDEAQVDYMSDYYLTPDQYRLLDGIRTANERTGMSA